MRIRRLRLAGFKSFVEPAELRIEPGLTGVVGPNGCGKSNLLEAIRWAMGEGSPKSLRGGGMDDVIFAGTTSRPPRDFAEVTIVVDRAGLAGEAPHEIEVIRRIERGSGSAYRINGRDARARDVALLFADAATGAHSPALVSQGRIGAIITARPVDRRAMLEEAAGIAGLHVRRKEAETRLRAAEANLARLDDLLTDMTGRTAALRRQARAAERYRALSDMIRVAEARLIWARWRDAAAAAEAATGEAAAAGGAVTAAGERRTEAAEAQRVATRALAEARERVQGARDAAAVAQQALAQARAEADVVARRIAELRRRRETLSRDRGREDQLAVDAAAAVARLAEEDDALEAAVAAGEEAVPPAEARVRAAEQAARDAEVALAQALATLAAEQAELRVADATLAAARQRRARAEGDLARIDADARALADAAPLIARREAAVRAGEAAMAASTESRAALDRHEAERDAAAKARARAEAQAATAHAALAALEAEARSLARAAPPAGGARVLDRIVVAAGYEAALAAALGDDLEAAVGARGWAGAAARASDPALPEGVAPLAGQVDAPPELARRLAQVGVVEADDGSIMLAAGQRLVTRGGRMRRWDGFVAAAGEGGAAAAALVRANRLRELERLSPPARLVAENGARALDDAADTLSAASRSIEGARRALAEAETAARTAAREGDAAAAALDRLDLQRGAVAERRGRSEREAGEARAEEAAAVEARTALPDGATASATAAGLRASGAAAAASLAAARADLAGLTQRLDADRRRREAARQEAVGWRSRAGDAAARLAEMERRETDERVEAETLEGRPAVLAERVAEAERDVAAADAAIRGARANESARESALASAERAAAAAAEALAAAREARAGAAARAEAQDVRRVELGRIAGERFACPAPLLPQRAGFAEADVRDAGGESATHDRLIAERERLGPVNLVAAQELAEIEASHAASAAERDELTEAIHRLRGSIGSLNREGRERLRAAFEAVDGHFRRLFGTLFGGGDAHLALIDSDDPLEAGLEIMAQPPGKRLSALTLLSGGEQALTAVALIFALFLTNPAPLCVLDEVDAPLDDANIERFCDLLDRMATETDTRYLIVTHNPVTMARMHRLFGVTMVERGVSRLASVDLGGAEGLLAAE